jgi:hypothetical protein
MVKSTTGISDEVEPDNYKKEEGKTCPICGKSYETEPALEVHMKIRHSNQE